MHALAALPQQGRLTLSDKLIMPFTRLRERILVLLGRTEESFEARLGRFKERAVANLDLVARQNPYKVLITALHNWNRDDLAANLVAHWILQADSPQQLEAAAHFDRIQCIFDRCSVCGGAFIPGIYHRKCLDYGPPAGIDEATIDVDQMLAAARTELEPKDLLGVEGARDREFHYALVCGLISADGQPVCPQATCSEPVIRLGDLCEMHSKTYNCANPSCTFTVLTAGTLCDSCELHIAQLDLI